MGLFSKPSADSLYESFGKLSEDEQKLFLSKFEQQQPAEEPQDKEEVEDTANNDNGDDTNVDTKVEDKSSEEPKAEDKFDEYFKKLTEENDKRFNELKDSFDKKFEELTKKQSEKKPFGLTENSKEYKATAKPKETSKDLLDKLFNK